MKRTPASGGTLVTPSIRNGPNHLYYTMDWLVVRFAFSLENKLSCSALSIVRVSESSYRVFTFRKGNKKQCYAKTVNSLYC